MIPTAATTASTRLMTAYRSNERSSNTNRSAAATRRMAAVTIDSTAADLKLPRPRISWVLTDALPPIT